MKSLLTKQHWILVEILDRTYNRKMGCYEYSVKVHGKDGLPPKCIEERFPGGKLITGRRIGGRAFKRVVQRMCVGGESHGMMLGSRGESLKLVQAMQEFAKH